MVSNMERSFSNFFSFFSIVLIKLGLVFFLLTIIIRSITLALFTWLWVNLMIVLNLLEKHWINLFKTLENIVKLIMVGCYGLSLISQGSSSINDIVVLLNIKQVILLKVVITLLLDLIFDNECHVTVRQTDIVFQVNPTMEFLIKSVSLMISKSLSLFLVSCILIYFAYPCIAFKLYTLFSNNDTLFLSDISLSFRIPENLRLKS